MILLGNKGYSVSKIKQRLKEEGLSVSKVSLYKLIKKENLFGTVADLPRRTIQPKIGKEQLIFIDEALAENDELTARLLRDMMIAKWPNLEISLSTIKRARKFIGWMKEQISCHHTTILEASANGCFVFNEVYPRMLN